MLEDEPSVEIPTEKETHSTTSAGKSKNKNTKKGKDGKKSFRRNRNEEDASRVKDETEVDEDRPKVPRLPKRQCGLLIGFCGSGYSGMQM